jgi:hypothetical protein
MRIAMMISELRLDKRSPMQHQLLVGSSTKRWIMGRSIRKLMRMRIQSLLDYADSLSFSHYFVGDDYNTVSKMLDTIQQNNDPTNPPFLFKVSCKKTADCGDGDTASLAITDALPRTDKFMPTIRLCPKFFDKNTAETKNDLNSKEFKRNPGRRDNSWCQPGSKFNDIEVAGHTLLHEMTHLDEVGSKHLVPFSIFN